MTETEKLQTTCRAARDLASGFVDECPELVDRALTAIAAVETALLKARPEEQEAVAVLLATQMLAFWATACTRLGIVTLPGGVH
jgi:hypothetical protein